MHLTSHLEFVMKNKGVKNLSELSLLSGVDKRKLEEFPCNIYNGKIDFETLNILSNFFCCHPNQILKITDKSESLNRLSLQENEGIVYFVSFENGLTKIGFTSDLQTRISALEQKEKMKGELIGYIATDDCLTIERLFHTMFENKLVRGEFFRLSEADMEMLKKYERGEKKNVIRDFAKRKRESDALTSDD